VPRSGDPARKEKLGVGPKDPTVVAFGPSTALIPSTLLNFPIGNYFSALKNLLHSEVHANAISPVSTGIRTSGE
jgi:hypothetical protein